MKDVEETKKEALESVPQIPSEQIPSREEKTDVLLEGSTEDKKKARELFFIIIIIFGIPLIPTISHSQVLSSIARNSLVGYPQT